MKINLVFIVILSYVTFEKVLGRKCYACVSIKSFGACDDDRKAVDCSNLFPGESEISCLKFSYKLSGESFYGKSCYPTSTCEAAENFCKEGVQECKTSCCNSDLCNKGVGVPLISGILLLTSVILGLFGI